MHWINWAIVLGYLAYISIDGIRRSRGTDKLEGYFLGNRNLGTAPGAPFGIAASTFDDPLTFVNTFHVPDQAGLGFGWQPNDKITDIRRITLPPNLPEGDYTP